MREPHSSHKGIRVNAICPGPIATPMHHKAIADGLFTAEAVSNTTALKRVGTAEEIGQ
jgi:NAD(P)-dependent dehydrogenase (short-subunit alcohol dehydrogenase family)